MLPELTEAVVLNDLLALVDLVWVSVEVKVSATLLDSVSLPVWLKLNDALPV